MTAIGPLGAVWMSADTWIVVVGALTAMSCALPGAFLLLRRQSMMGDAISHAVLPGLAAAFLLTGSRDSVVMLAGAAVVGVLTAVFTEWIRSAGRVDESASMGVVFTVLFAIGLILIRQAAHKVDLDADCVLYGDIVFAPIDTRAVLGFDIPRAALVGAGALAMNLLFVALLYKELTIAAFDPALATTLGLRAGWMNLLLMAVVAVTTVLAFETVGSILVIAMLIVPAAAAHLLTDRLPVLLVLALVLACASAALGHAAAISVPAWLGLGDAGVSTSGMMAVAAGGLYVVAMVVGPRHGLVSRFAYRAGLAVRIAREDMLGLLYRRDEPGGEPTSVSTASLKRGTGASNWVQSLALRSLRRRGLLLESGGLVRLSEAGRVAARGLVRSHRLWESYLERRAQVPPDHVHELAARLEHVSDESLAERLSRNLGDPGRDPHGREIPPP